MENEKKKQSSETDQPFLPMDIWTEVLLRIPAEDLLAKLRFVCMSWYQLITSDRSFARAHVDHWKAPGRRPFNESCGFAVHTNCTVDGFPSSSILYFTLHLEGKGLRSECRSFLLKDFSYLLPSKDIRLLASCDGLLLIGCAMGGGDCQLVVCNPITGSYRRLPVFHPSHAGYPWPFYWGILESYEWVLARNASTGQYKVFAVQIHADSRRRCHIFELQRAYNEEQQSWKELDAPLPAGWMIETSTVREGKVYWLAWPTTPTVVKILSMDIATEELRVSAPIELLPEMMFCIARNGAFYCVERGEDQERWLWGLENLGDNPTWVKIKDRSIEHHPPRSEEFVMPGGVKLVINSRLNYGVRLNGTDLGCPNYLIHWDADKAIRHVNSLIGFD